MTGSVEVFVEQSGDVIVDVSPVGSKGDIGIGIKSIVFNEETGRWTVTLTNDVEYETGSVTEALETYESNAASSASAAATQAGVATTQAGIATTRAGEAAGSASTATTQAGIATGAAGTATTQAGIATTQAGVATTKATEADGSAQLSQDWAEKTSAPAGPDTMSARTAAEIGIYSALSAQEWAEGTEPGGPGTKSAQEHAADAGNQATAAATSAAQAALYDGVWLDDVATVIADETLSYGPGASGVSEGDYVRTRAEGFSYQVAAEGATDHHLTTAGGVKLYVLKHSGQWHFSAFGAAQDGTTDDTAAWAALLAAYKADPAKIILSGFSRVTSPIFYQTDQDAAAGLDVFGVIPGTCGVIGDFTGDYLVGVDGSSLAPWNFQQYGGFQNVSLKTTPAATIKRGIQSVGWWRANHENLTIGVQDDDAQGFTEHGIFIPLRADINANPDAYASVNWSLTKVRVYNCGGSGIKGDNNTGYAGWNLQDCTFENNGVDGVECHTNGWRMSGGSCSYNGRYGINYSGEAGVTLTNGFFASTELDGNGTANVFIERIHSGVFLNPRSISRILNGAETALSQFKISNLQVCAGLRVISPYCRIEGGMTSAVEVFDTPASSNIQNCVVESLRVLDSGAGGYTAVGAAFTDLRYKNEATDYLGNPLAAAPKRIAWQSYTSQSITTTTTIWNFNVGARLLGSSGVYDTGTGVFTMPYKGAFLLTLNANVDTLGAGERIRVFAYKNGAVARQWYWDWKSGAEPDRINISVSEIFDLEAGDTLDIRVDSVTGTLALFNTGSLSIMGL